MKFNVLDFFYLTRLKGEHLPSLGVRRPS